jgi:RNA polymerase-binding protein DksA
MKASELSKFRKILLEKKKLIQGNVSKMEDEVLKNSDRDISVDHMADNGSDNFEQDFNLSLIENEGQQLREIEEALARIDDKSFGQCEACHSAIASERLKAIPYARLCIECQKLKEEGRLEW